MNKKIPTIFFAFLFSIILLSLASASLTVSSKPSSLEVYQESNVESSFTLYNDGTYNITDITINSGTLPSGINMTYNTSNIPLLMPGQSYKINFTVTANSNADPGIEKLTINANGSNSTSFTFDLEVKQNYCENGEEGSKLRVEINEPDNGDDFYAGDNITVEVNVENRDNDEIDFVIEAQLYDISTGKEIDAADLDATLDEDEDDYFELYLKVPSDMDKDDDYAIRVKVYEYRNEDEQCKEDSKDVDLKKRSHDLTIDKVILNSPEACNGPMDLTVKVSNTGSNDEDDTTVTISNDDLGINLEKTADVNEENTESFYFSTTLPVVAPGEYELLIEVNSEDASDYYRLKLDLQTNCKAQVKDVQIFVIPQTGYIDQEVIFKATITNNGDVATTYNIAAQNYQFWANLTSISPTQVTLNPGESQDITIILKPLASAASINTFQVKASYGTELKTQDATLTIQTPGNDGITGSAIGDFFRNLGKNIWILIINVVLLLIIIGLIILLAVRPKKKQVEQPKEARLRKRK